MPFNDLFVLDLASELNRQSFNLVPENKDSQASMAVDETVIAEPATQ